MYNQIKSNQINKSDKIYNENVITFMCYCCLYRNRNI